MIFAVLLLLASPFILVVMIYRSLTARSTTILKNGVPYCSNCGRQVSRRRDACRACGAPTVVYGRPPHPVDSGPLPNREAIPERKAGGWAIPEWLGAILLGVVIAAIVVLFFVALFKPVG